MLVESISDLAKKVGAERISIEISPVDEVNVNIMLITKLAHTWDAGDASGDDNEIPQLRAILANPISMSCSAGEADRKIVIGIDSLIQEMAVAAKKVQPDSITTMRDRLRNGGNR